MLRLLTCGSVDDGKSTLIGRLLYDTRAVFADQLAAIERVSRRRNGAVVREDQPLDLSLFTDGLRWEREQGITIDVAYRYFATAARRFILIDSPGHAQYTRNMVTGASHADVAVILVDARRGVQEQTRRHAYIAALLGIRHLVVAVNKLDLVGWDAGAFEAVREVIEAFRPELGDVNVSYIPVSAIHGDNIVTRSSRMNWYDGPTLLETLESIPSPHANDDEEPARFPVQWIVRPRAGDDGRGYAGQVASGRFEVGQRILAVSSGLSSTIASVRLFDRELSDCRAPQSVVIHLADDIDIGRGELLAPADDPPTLSRELSATLVWMGPAPLEVGKRYLLRHATHFTPAVVTAVDSRLDVATLRYRGEPGVTSLKPNEIGTVRVRTASPLAFDAYARSRGTGAFVLIDESTHDTAGGGLIRDAE